MSFILWVMLWSLGWIDLSSIVLRVVRDVRRGWVSWSLLNSRSLFVMYLWGYFSVNISVLIVGECMSDMLPPLYFPEWPWNFLRSPPEWCLLAENTLSDLRLRWVMYKLLLRKLVFQFFSKSFFSFLHWVILQDSRLPDRYKKEPFVLWRRFWIRWEGCSEYCKTSRILKYIKKILLRNGT